MGQQPFSIICGTANITRPNCPPSNNYSVDADAGGHAILYSKTQQFSPCKAPIVDNATPGAGLPAWNPGYLTSASYYALYDAAHPPGPNAYSYPLPPHGWGWTGADDYKKLTYYSLSTTIAAVAATSNLFPVFQNISVTLDYDLHTVRRFSRRTVTYSRGEYPHTGPTQTGDTWADLSSSDTLVHQTVVLWPRVPVSQKLPLNPWNQVDMVWFDHDTAGKQDGTGTPFKFAGFIAEWQDSGYYDASAPGASGRSFHTDTTLVTPGTPQTWQDTAVYEFGRETRTVTNVKLTIDATWTQYHCVAVPGGTPPPCTCNNDCPPCQGSNPALHSGKCVSLCANGDTSDTLVDGWKIKDNNGTVKASSDSPSGWKVTRTDTCAIQICAPCLSKADYAAGHYQGPFTLTWGTSDTCSCPPDPPKYKIFVASFELLADVICPDATPPQSSGRSVSYDVSEAHRHARAYIANQTANSPGKVIVGLASDVFPLNWQDGQSNVTANEVCVRFDRQSLPSTLYLLAASGTSVSLQKSVDEGKTFSSVATIGSGSHPALICTRDGRKLCYWYSGSNIMGKFLDTAGNVERDTFSAISGADDDTLTADESVDKDGIWRVTLIFRSSGTITTKSSIDGVVFT